MAEASTQVAAVEAPKENVAEAVAKPEESVPAAKEEAPVVKTEEEGEKDKEVAEETPAAETAPAETPSKKAIRKKFWRGLFERVKAKMSRNRKPVTPSQEANTSKEAITAEAEPKETAETTEKAE